MAKILIIGGSGFLGATISRRAMAEGHQVWILTRGRSPAPAGTIPLVADRQDDAAFARVVAEAHTQWDVVIDSAAYTPEDIDQDIRIFTPLAGHFIFVSTDFVYDPARRKFPQPENAEHYLRADYGGLKRQAELRLLDCTALRWSIVRPTHIYGPGSRLGCLPLHGRDPQLIEHLRAGKPLRLIGGGRFLQQPVLADDLARTILSLPGNPASHGGIFNVAGPAFVESREFYRLIAQILQVPLTVEEVPVDAHLQAHPEAAPFLCHRLYDRKALRAIGAHLPTTPLEEGLRSHVSSLTDLS